MSGEPAQPTANSRPKRVLIGLAWGLIQLVILAVLFFAGMLAAGYLSIDAFGGRGTNALVETGFTAGIVAAVVVNHSARSWLQRWRLRGLRFRGVAVKAEVVDLGRQYTASTRGPGTTRYKVLVRWREPVTGVSWQGERRYRLWGRGSRRLEAACADGARIQLYYPPGRPSRFIIDIPFAPTMADFFL